MKMLFGSQAPPWKEQPPLCAKANQRHRPTGQLCPFQRRVWRAGSAHVSAPHAQGLSNASRSPCPCATLVPRGGAEARRKLVKGFEDEAGPVLRTVDTATLKRQAGWSLRGRVMPSQ